MAKKKPADDDTTPVDTPSTVTVNLKDEHERETCHMFEVDPADRARVYHHDGIAYEASRQEPDGSWTYRKTTS